MLPMWLKTGAVIMADIDKRHSGGSIECGKNIHKSDSVNVGIDPFAGVITISTDAAKGKDVDVVICKDGMPVFVDNDRVEKGSGLSYVMSDDEVGEYDIRIAVDGKDCVSETILREE